VIWSLDSNILVDALRIPEARARLAAFIAEGNVVVMSSIVVAEMEFGARTARAVALLDADEIGMLLRRGRIIAPSESDWRRTGRLLGDHPEWARTASRQNDVLLAVQCAERGWALITRDRDFGEFMEHLPSLRLFPPFPQKPPLGR